MVGRPGELFESNQCSLAIATTSSTAPLLWLTASVLKELFLCVHC